MVEEFSVGLVVVAKDEFLILRYGAGHWGFVKGKPEKDESENETAVRELEEETGISRIEILDGFSKELDYHFTKNRKIVHKTVKYLVGEVLKQDIVLSREHSEYKWLRFDDALKRLTFENAKSVLRAANVFLKKN